MAAASRAGTRSPQSDAVGLRGGTLPPGTAHPIPSRPLQTFGEIAQRAKMLRVGFPPQLWASRSRLATFAPAMLRRVRLWGTGQKDHIEVAKKGSSTKWVCGNDNIVNMLLAGEHSAPDPSAPPLALGNCFSAPGVGWNFSLFSRVMRVGLNTGVGARRAESVLSLPIFSGPDDCADLVNFLQPFGSHAFSGCPT